MLTSQWCQINMFTAVSETQCHKWPMMEEEQMRPMIQKGTIFFCTNAMHDLALDCFHSCPSTCRRCVGLHQVCVTSTMPTVQYQTVIRQEKK